MIPTDLERYHALQVRNERDCGVRLKKVLAGIGDSRLAEAMRYASLGRGQRLRPWVTRMAASEEIDLSEDEDIWMAALSVELIHAYSLVHDDLPGLDDDDERRGSPSTHVVYGEDIAIMVGDGLQSLAFEVLAGCGNGLAGELVGRMARAVGVGGLVGGQTLELIARGDQRELEADQIAEVRRGKTGALFGFATSAAALIVGEDDERMKSIGSDIGIAYQMLDDIRDDTDSEERARWLAVTECRELLDDLDQRISQLERGRGMILLTSFFRSQL